MQELNRLPTHTATVPLNAVWLSLVTDRYVHVHFSVSMSPNVAQVGSSALVNPLGNIARRIDEVLAKKKCKRALFICIKVPDL